MVIYSAIILISVQVEQDVTDLTKLYSSLVPQQTTNKTRLYSAAAFIFTISGHFDCQEKKIPITSMSLIPKIYSGIKGTRTVKFEVFFKIQTLNLVPVPKGIKHRLYINNGQRH